MKFVKLLFTIFYFVRAKNLIQKEDDEKAYNYLKKINEEIIERYYAVEYHLFLGLTSLSLRKFTESEKHLRITLDLIDNNRNLKLNNDEKKYLKCYAINLLYIIYKYLDKNTNLFQNEIENLKNQFDRNNINSVLLGFFPLNLNT